jgi:hypothetical protein
MECDEDDDVQPGRLSSADLCLGEEGKEARLRSPVFLGYEKRCEGVGSEERNEKGGLGSG